MRLPFRVTHSPRKSLSYGVMILSDSPKCAVSSPEESFPHCEMCSSTSQKSLFHDAIKALP